MEAERQARVSELVNDEQEYVKDLNFIVMVCSQLHNTPLAKSSYIIISIDYNLLFCFVLFIDGIIS